ncbi:TPA: hypothetical protein DEP96_02950 [Candidatus Uhrbacteria bacterium]|nr:hypothetical protein [Candidatus Uhrbacteria bacterium]
MPSMNIQDTIMPILRKANSLGVELLDDGTQLIGHVPHVAPRARLHVVPPGLKESEVNQLEIEVGKTIPDEYKQLLIQTNGLSIYSDSLSFYGLRADFIRNERAPWLAYSMVDPNNYERPRDAKDSYVFIGGYSYDGSSLFIDSNSGKVFRCAQFRASEIYNIWPDFWTMLTSEVERLDSLFNAEGKKKDPSRPTTPEPNIKV